MVKRVHKENGVYKVKGVNYPVLVGSRAQVWHKTAYKTTGGLTRKDLLMNRNGRIVSKVKHTKAKSRNRLKEHGFYNKKGVFGAFTKKGSPITKKKRKTRKRSR